MYVVSVGPKDPVNCSVAAAGAFVATEFKGHWPSLPLSHLLAPSISPTEKDLNLTLILRILELSQQRGENPSVSRLCF